jgi:S1-C subfamily serine protease
VLRRRLIPFAVAAAAVAALAGHGSAATAPVASPTKGVVLVTTDLAYQNAAAAGTGIVLTAGGEVLTNNHVIRGATTINIIVPATHKKYAAEVIGYDVADDIALLQVDGAPTLATATRGVSAKVRVGQFARAVGNANGGGKLVITTGKITALGQTITVNNEDGGTSILRGLIRTSAHLVPGDSGGPLLNASGRVIGVDAAGSADYRIVNSDGYAIPIDRAYALARLMEAGKSSATVHIGKTAFLGVTLATSQRGLVIGSVVGGSGAANAGIQPGFILKAFDGAAVASLDDVRSILFTHHPGDVITVDYIDSFGQPGTTSLTLGDGPPQ